MSCGKDWKAFLAEDSPRTLFFLDPPWEGVPSERMDYAHNSPIGAQEVFDRTKGLKGAVAIAYKDDKSARAALCQAPFRCSKIHKNFFGRPFTQLLAVKPPAPL